MKPRTACRLYAILARESARAVLFRRGPSKLVQLIAWHRGDDRFTPGQWLKGRIYERRCDLSPKGDKLIYFAADHKPPLRSWTAVSKPPYLTALLLWPKGDCWGGGGLFQDRRTLLLNHRPWERELKEGLSYPPGIQLLRFGARPGWGEDDPICHERLLRDGWRLTDKGKEHERPYKPKSKIWIVYDPPIVYEKPMPRASGLLLRALTKGHLEWGGRSRVVEHQLAAGGATLELGATDWADWDKNGDLLYSRDGKLFRLPREAAARLDASKSVELADFTHSTFSPLKAPSEALRWE